MKPYFRIPTRLFHGDDARPAAVPRCAAARPEFKSDVLTFVQGGTSPRIELQGYAPRVKVERLLTQLFHAHPDLEVERVRVSGQSGCSDFSGVLTVFAGDCEHRIAFTWCCAWRAEQEGWRDYFGFWDQARAAREFGFRCYSRWEVEATVRSEQSVLSA